MQAETPQNFHVFVFPQTLDFYLPDRSTHQRTLALYNPYDFSIRFRVLGTSPNKYAVAQPEGSVKSHFYIYILFRHNEVIPANCNVTDKFRIQILDHTTKKIIGQRDLPAILHSSVPEKPLAEDENFESIQTQEASDQIAKPKQFSLDTAKPSVLESTNTPYLIALFSGLVCVITLLLPNEGEESSVPLQVTFNVKLVSAYVLGLVTMVIFRT